MIRQTVTSTVVHRVLRHCCMHQLTLTTAHTTRTTAFDICQRQLNDRYYRLLAWPEPCLDVWRLHWSSGWCIRLRCERTQVRISPQTVMFISMATAMCSLGHELHTFTVVPRSSRPSTVHGTLKWASAYRINNNNEWRRWLWMVVAFLRKLTAQVGRLGSMVGGYPESASFHERIWVHVPNWYLHWF